MRRWQQEEEEWFYGPFGGNGAYWDVGAEEEEEGSVLTLAQTPRFLPSPLLSSHSSSCPLALSPSPLRCKEYINCGDPSWRPLMLAQTPYFLSSPSTHSLCFPLLPTPPPPLLRYKEYINCGKGRDMGFDSINGFNFKVAGGGGEWAISRESARLGCR